MLPADLPVEHRVRLTAYALIVVHGLVKAWVLLPSWFYSDDFIFLEDALQTGLTPQFLLTPHDSQLMPLGVAISWFVAHAGAYNWTLAAAITIGLQVLAAWCCLLMLHTVFGERPSILVPLTFYLFSTMSIEAMVWWAAALNAVPMQIAFFLLVTFVVRWGRERHWRWALAAGAALLLGAVSGPRGLVMIAPVGMLLLLFLTPGRWWTRPWQVVRTHALLVVPLLVVGVGYLVVYAASTPAPVEANGDAPAGAIARNLLGVAWLPSLVGGPWRWNENNPPMNQPDPPVVVYVLAAVVLTILLVTAARRGLRCVVAALTILAAQLAITYAAVVFGRGVQLGADAGLMTRYLTDTLPVTALVLGLLLVPVAGSSTTIRPAWVSPRLRPAVWSFGAIFLLGTAISTVNYASSWHAEYPARSYVENARTSLAAEPTAQIAEVEVPNIVQSRLSYPHNLPSHVLAPLGDLVQTTYAGNDLRVLDDEGFHQQAAIFASTSTAPGPVRDCGHRVTRRPVDLRLRDRVQNPFWWMSVGYLASGDGRVEIIVEGQEPRIMEVQNGLHTYFMRGEGEFGSVRLVPRTPNLTICVDTLNVGDLVPVS